MTATTHRRTVAEMEKRLASARDLIEHMIRSYEGELAKYEAQAEVDPRSWSAATGSLHARGMLGGLRSSLAHLTACFDDPERDWMYRLP